MRILHVCEVATGGAIGLARVYAAGQAAGGHEPHLLVPRDADPGGDRVHTWVPRRRSPHRYPTTISRLRQVVRDVDPDVVHLHSFFAGLLGRLHPSTLAGTAVVYQPHSWAFQAVRPAAAAAAIAAWERLAARRTHMVATNCEDELREGRDHGVAAPAAVLGLPVDTERFAPVDDAERDRLRKELDLTTSHVLVCVGRVCLQKGQDQLVAAWERRPIPDTTLVLVGDGDTPALARSAPRTWGTSVLAVGGRSDVRPWLWSADLCVMPSRYEGQSVAMGEALATGLPTVITDVNGARAAVAPPHGSPAGAVVSLADMDGLLDACRRRLGDPATLAAESRAARARAATLFATGEVIRRLDALYHDACDRRGHHAPPAAKQRSAKAASPTTRPPAPNASSGDLR